MRNVATSEQEDDLEHTSQTYSSHSQRQPAHLNGASAQARGTSRASSPWIHLKCYFYKGLQADVTSGDLSLCTNPGDLECFFSGTQHQRSLSPEWHAKTTFGPALSLMEWVQVDVPLRTKRSAYIGSVAGKSFAGAREGYLSRTFASFCTASKVATTTNC